MQSELYVARRAFHHFSFLYHSVLPSCFISLPRISFWRNAFIGHSVSTLCLNSSLASAGAHFAGHSSVCLFVDSFPRQIRMQAAIIVKEPVGVQTLLSASGAIKAGHPAPQRVTLSG